MHMQNGECTEVSVITSLDFLCLKKNDHPAVSIQYVDRAGRATPERFFNADMSVSMLPNVSTDGATTIKLRASDVVSNSRTETAVERSRNNIAQPKS